MLVDLEEVSAHPERTHKAAVCIAGAGVAGLVLATTLAEAGIDVHLLEAGGLRLEDRSQTIYNAEMASTTHAGTTVGRFRVFGGTSTRWGGQLLPYSSEVFCPPATLLSPRWPLTSDALEPFYPRIEKLLGANHLPFTTELYDHLGMPVPAEFDQDSDVVLRFSKWAPFSHRNLAQTLGRAAIASQKITVYLHANLVECLLSPDNPRIDGFVVRNYKGDNFRFEAHEYVMATGTIETSRLLLASRRVSVNGLGNTHDQVGRGLHDHVSLRVAAVTGEARHKALSWFGPFLVGGTTHVGRIEASTILRERLGLLAVQAHFTIEEPEDSGFFVARHLLRSMQRGGLCSAIVDNLPRLPSASWDIARLMWTAKIRKRRAVSSRAVMPLEILCEQRPRPENRILLVEGARDALGMLKAAVDWRVGSDETRSMLRYAKWLQVKFKSLGSGLASFRTDLTDEANIHLPDIRDNNHPMGGTVMGSDPKRAVVDTDLKIHGALNMSIASCSTFPGGGSSNPTFTLIALTLRLAERLKRTLSHSTAHGASSILV